MPGRRGWSGRGFSGDFGVCQYLSSFIAASAAFEYPLKCGASKDLRPTNQLSDKDLSIAEDGTGHRWVRCDFSKRNSTYECADNAACFGEGSAPLSKNIFEAVEGIRALVSAASARDLRILPPRVRIV